MPAGLVTLFLGLILMALAFVPGSAVWKTLHDALFGVFGCGSFVVGAALCYLAILYTRGGKPPPPPFQIFFGGVFFASPAVFFF